VSDSCAACTGACCSNVIVRVTGYDAWRIKRAQGLEFRQFLYTQPDDGTLAGGFLIAGERLATYLGKSAAHPPACTFLMHLPGDVRRCGVYADRPRVCAVYPMTIRNGSVDLRTDVFCKPSNWNMATLTYPAWRRSLLEHYFELSVYDRVATSWSERYGRTEATLDDYYRYVEASFDDIDAAQQRRGDLLDESILHWQDATSSPESKAELTEFFDEIDRACAAAGDKLSSDLLQ
jgi:Fe-S-cluster containining protein